MRLTYSRIAGGTAATCTMPLDVVRVRMQSSQYGIMRQSPALVSPMSQTYLRVIHHTFLQVQNVNRTEGFRALFKGLGPNLVGVIPSRAVHFGIYERTKRYLMEHGFSSHSPWIHMCSATAAVLSAASVTNPIFVVKTRM